MGISIGMHLEKLLCYLLRIVTWTSHSLNLQNEGQIQSMVFIIARARRFSETPVYLFLLLLSRLWIITTPNTSESF